MFEKIRSHEDLKTLHCGCWLVKYPLINQSFEEIDLSDERLFSLFEISEINVHTDSVHLVNLDSERASKNLQPPVKPMPGENNSVEIKKDDLIKERVWWYRT